MNCARCHGPNQRVPQKYCHTCHAAYMRSTRKPHSQLSDVERQKANCRAYSKVLLRRGKLTKEPCKSCGGEAQMHHPDYSNPRLVEWLCRPCHLSHHRAERDVIMLQNQMDDFRH